MPEKSKAKNEQFPHLQPVEASDDETSRDEKKTLPEGFSFHECMARVSYLDEDQKRKSKMHRVGYLLRVDPPDGIGRPMYCSTNASLKPREFSCTPVVGSRGKTAKQLLVATAHFIVERRKEAAKYNTLAVQEKKATKERIENYVPYAKDDRFEIVKGANSG